MTTPSVTTEGKLWVFIRFVFLSSVWQCPSNRQQFFFVGQSATNHTLEYNDDRDDARAQLEVRLRAFPEYTGSSSREVSVLQRVACTQYFQNAQASLWATLSDSTEDGAWIPCAVNPVASHVSSTDV
mgnify:CR=1 FL=1